jgi:hypothetical protein
MRDVVAGNMLLCKCAPAAFAGVFAALRFLYGQLLEFVRV